MNWALASFYIAIGTFNGLITFVGMYATFMPRLYWPVRPTGISEYFFFFLAVLGISRLRSIKPEDPYSYRTWTFNPVIFCLVSGFLVLRGIITDAFQASAIFILIIAGWFIFKHWFREEVSTRWGRSSAILPSYHPSIKLGLPRDFNPIDQGAVNFTWKALI